MKGGEETKKGKVKKEKMIGERMKIRKKHLKHEKLE